MERNVKQEFYEKLMVDGICKINSVPIPYNINHFKEYVECRYYQPTDTSFIFPFLRSDNYLETLKSQPLMVSNLPVAYFTEPELWLFLQQNVYSILTFPQGEISKEMYVYAISKDPMLFAFLGTEHQDIEIAKYMVDVEPLLLEYVADDLRFYWLCEKAITKNWMALRYVPGDVLDAQLVEKALVHQDAYILDIVPHTFLNKDIYARHFEKYPERSLNTMVASLLNDRDYSLLIDLMETTENFNPERLFKEVDPKIICDTNRESALLNIFNARPHWVHYLPSEAVTDNIFEFAIDQGELLELTPICWSADKMAIAFQTNRQAFTKIPLERMSQIGAERLFQILLTAVEQQWIDQLPSYFFIDALIDNEYAHSILMEQRNQYAIVVTDGENFNFEKLHELDFSIDELLRVKVKADNLPEELLVKNIANYVLLSDAAKTFERSMCFVKAYPHHYKQVPEQFFNNKEDAQRLIDASPLISRYLPSEQLFEIYKKF